MPSTQLREVERHVSDDVANNESTDQIQCPCCGPSNFAFRFEKKGKKFYRCDDCEIELQWPIPSLEELAAYYEQSFQEGMYSDFTSADEMKQMTATQRMREIGSHLPAGGSHLDVGCANGVFVSLAGERFESDGVELSLFAVQSGREKGLNLYAGTIDDLPEEKRYDCITAFDVLEHVVDPNAFLASIRNRLVDDGVVAFTVPNTGGIVRRLMGKRWYFYIPEEHLHYFNAKNLEQLLGKHGFEVVNAGATYKPMTYDYSLTQFKEFNPLIFKVLNAFRFLVPKSLRTRPIPLPIGEIRIVARKLPMESAVVEHRLDMATA